MHSGAYFPHTKEYCSPFSTVHSKVIHYSSNIGTASRWSISIYTWIFFANLAIAAQSDCGNTAPALTPAQAGKFSLSQEACRFAIEPLPQALPAAANARQLELYDKATLARPKPVDSVAIEPTPMPAIPMGFRARRHPEPSAQRALQLAPEVDAVARRHDIDPLLLHSIAHVESRHNAAAVSRAGALGVMQVMPATARRFGVSMSAQLQDAHTNLDVSAAYLKTLQQRFGNDLALVLASYNAGEGAVERHGRRIPPYKETQLYVVEVLKRYGELSAVARDLHLGQRQAPASAP